MQGNEDNRVSKACKACGCPWLLESKVPEWHGSVKALRRFEEEQCRQWTKCYCGRELYED